MALRIVISPHAGFCFGVRRAIRLAEEATAQRGQVYSLGPLIHNRQAVERLRDLGLIPVESIDEVPDAAPVMIRTHGAGPALVREAQQRGHEIVDATCPFVARAHKSARRFHEQGYQVFVLGDRSHPESLGIVEYTGGEAIIVEEPEEIDQLDLAPRVAIVCQTTQRFDRLQALVQAVLPRVQELLVANTICDATTQRQQASEALAHEADVMLVVGGYHSANTRRLYEICSATGTPTYHIEVPEEIRAEWVSGARTVGITAGASTPDEIIAAVAERVAELGGAGSEIVWPTDASRNSLRREGCPDANN
ncbi:MAG: 4-hydroxy-3-methylbut-2-enyl diphosphate reductase [Armatimonadetes bacterium]|nr:4-hydroxy-3-methylbut-2-enyl diphosphate reductase [Armatimonadota bacterium]